MKVQRVDFSASDWLGGTIGLSIAERGVYVTACALIYTQGGAIFRADLRRACPGEGRAFSRAVNRLIETGKLVMVDGRMDQKRCEIELERAKKRIENATKNGHLGGRPASKNNELENQKVSSTRGQKGEAKNLPKEIKESRGGLGRSAPSEPEPPPTPEAIAEVVALVEQATAALKGDVPKGIRDPTAYRAAIKTSKFSKLVTAVNLWVGTGLDGAARIAAWEVLALAADAGARSAMAPAARKVFDEIVEMYRASNAASKMLEAAE